MHYKVQPSLLSGPQVLRGKKRTPSTSIKNTKSLYRLNLFFFFFFFFCSVCPKLSDASQRRSPSQKRNSCSDRSRSVREPQWTPCHCNPILTTASLTDRRPCLLPPEEEHFFFFFCLEREESRHLPTYFNINMQITFFHNERRARGGTQLLLAPQVPQRDQSLFSVEHHSTH